MQPSDLRVALFSGNYNYVRDGANQALNRLVGHLLAHGAAVRVYSPTVATPAFAGVGDIVSLPSVKFPGGRGEYRFSSGVNARIRRDLSEFAPNIVHCSAPDVSGHRAVSWARRHGIASVASLHTRFETYPQYYGMAFLAPALEALQRRFYQRFDEVLVPGRGMAELLHEWGVTTPIGIWSRGVDHARFSPTRRSDDWRASRGIGADEVAVGFLGRLVKEKGLDVFARVALALKRRGVPHRIVVIGDGPARDWFQRQVPDAIFAGFQSGDDLGRAVASLDIFFNPSVTESFGNVTLEAMAAGVPVVAARASGTIGLVDDDSTGLLVRPRAIGGYADAIERLARDPALRRSYGAAGHAKAQGYDWDAINDAVVAAYHRVLDAQATKASTAAPPST
ncbi:MAG: glycosyltransferase family 1 protein [Pseudomonadota bacterium]